MYCPQCGTLNQDDAISCRNCGTALTDVNNPKEKAMPEKVRASSWITSIASLGIGILSFCPYIIIMPQLYSPILRRISFLGSTFEGILFVLGYLNGFPLGLVGIILGVIAWRRSRRNIKVKRIAISGTLLSIGAIAGHVWLIVWSIVTCAFCQ